MSPTAVFEFLRSKSHLKHMRIDSRQIQPGDVFVAVPGLVTDGRQYIPQAIKNGAAAILVEAHGWSGVTPVLDASNIEFLAVESLTQHLPAIAAFFYRTPSSSLKIIGMTGTNGKTSTSHYIAQLLTAAGHMCGVMGTLGNGILNQLEPASLTTSDCCTVQQQFAALLCAGAKYAAIEVSSIGLDQGRLAQTIFDTAVFTNLSQDHLDYHKNMEEYFAAKCKLFSDFALKHAVVNIDDAYSQRLLAIIPTTVSVITYSLHNANADVFLNQDTLTTPWGNGILQTSLFGKFNQSNVLAAIACCGLQGIKLATLLQSARTLQPVTGRMELISNGSTSIPRVIVDYAHTPDALVKALQTIREYQPRKLFCIFGCGGDRDRTKRPLMTRAVLEYSDEIVITNDNPRTEDPQQIVQDMLAGNAIAANVTIELDRAKAIQHTLARATAEDAVLIAGKGHEDYQIVGTTILPFSDQAVALNALGDK